MVRDQWGKSQTIMNIVTNTKLLVLFLFVIYNLKVDFLKFLLDIHAQNFSNPLNKSSWFRHLYMYISWRYNVLDEYIVCIKKQLPFSPSSVVKGIKSFLS